MAAVVSFLNISLITHSFLQLSLKIQKTIQNSICIHWYIKYMRLDSRLSYEQNLLTEMITTLNHQYITFKLLFFKVHLSSWI